MEGKMEEEEEVEEVDSLLKPLRTEESQEMLLNHFEQKH
jgi:hypothetical protein